MDSIKTLLSQINKFWSGKSAVFKRNAIIIASGVLVVVIVASVLLNHVEYSELYRGLDAADSAAVVAALEEQNIPHKVSGDTILVPAGDADRLKLTLASEVKGSFNLDILDKGNGLGTTESARNDYRKYQIQTDIERALKSLTGVRDALAVITMGSNTESVLLQNRQDATASVVLTLDNGVELNDEQITSVYNFVAKAVPGLKTENISIMDSFMNNLEIGGMDPSVSASDRIELQKEVQSSLQGQLMDFLQPVFGPGNVKAVVNVTLDFDKKTTDSVRFEPLEGTNAGVVDTIEELREEIENNGEAAGEPGTETNTGTSTYPVNNVDNGTYEKYSKKIKYQISTIQEHLEKEQGAIKFLSVGIIINKTDTTEDYTDTVTKLVSAAMGVGPEYITVSYMPMTGANALTDALAKESAAAQEMAKGQQLRFFVIIGAAALVLVVAMLLLFSTMAAKRKHELAMQNAALGAQAAAMSEGESFASELEEMEAGDIKIVKESGTKGQIGKLIETNPELVVNLLRTWLADDQE